MKILITLLAALAVAAVVATDPWWSHTLTGNATLVLLLSVVGGLCWLDGYTRKPK